MSNQNKPTVHWQVPTAPRPSQVSFLINALKEYRHVARGPLCRVPSRRARIGPRPGNFTAQDTRIRLRLDGVIPNSVISFRIVSRAWSATQR